MHANKGVRRYRYYISRASLVRQGQPGSLHRISAGVLEQYLGERLSGSLAANWRADLELHKRAIAAIEKITLSEDQIIVRLGREAIRPDAEGLGEPQDGGWTVRLDFQMRRRQGAMIIAPAAGPSPTVKIDRALVRALVLAKTWANRLETGAIKSIKALADQEGLCHHYTARLLPLAYLAPDIADDILAGRQHRAVSLAALTAKALPLDWAQQRELVAGLGARHN